MEWRCDEDTMTWRWSEHGGPPIAADVNPSFGMQILKSLIPYELDGQSDMDLSGDGLVFESSIPLGNITRRD